MREEIIAKIEKDKIKKMGVKKIGIFGSYAKGKQHKKSDIDILVSFNKEDFGEQYFKLLFYLEDLFHKKIDLIPLQNLRKELKYVIKEAQYVKL
jgi:predicted nucleotidyltransferase